MRGHTVDHLNDELGEALPKTRVAQSNTHRGFKERCVDLVLGAMVLVSMIGLFYQCFRR
jgi:hypothetical protein